MSPESNSGAILLRSLPSSLRPRFLSPSLPFSAPSFLPPRSYLFARHVARRIPLVFPFASGGERAFRREILLFAGGLSPSPFFLSARTSVYARFSRCAARSPFFRSFSARTRLPPAASPHDKFVCDKLAPTIKINRSGALLFSLPFSDTN